MRLCANARSWWFDSYGSLAPQLYDRFHGNVGDRYTVECPTSCTQATAQVFGCGLGPYLDESSICKAAVGASLIGDDIGGMVTIELVPPVQFYPACSMRGFNDLDDPSKGKVQIETMKWQWYKWRWPDRPASIQRFCDQNWIDANPGVPCEKAIDHYRVHCSSGMGHKHCFGKRAFKFIEPCAIPTMDPSSGIFEDAVNITVTAGDDDPTTFIVCTTDGTAPDASSKGKMPHVPPDGIVTLLPGNYTVKCQAASSLRGPSRIGKAKIDVLPRLPLPDIDPDTDSTFVEQVMVSIDAGEEGATVYYTTDGSDPSPDSSEYTDPFVIDTIGANTIKAMSQKVEWADSYISTSEIVLLERLPSPSFEPYMGAFETTVTVHLTCDTEGTAMHYTLDGSTPTAASPAYDAATGIVLGLGADGKEATYVLKAMAMLPPDMGDSYVATSGELVVQPPVATPVIAPSVAGPYTNTVEVTITSATEGATIRYTTDGSGKTRQ